MPITDDNLLERQEVKLKRPKQYQVVLFNDDFTPVEFVVFVLARFFQKSEAEAVSIMMEAHTKGRAICGVYSRDVAETKATAAMSFSRAESFALRFEIQRMD